MNTAFKPLTWILLWSVTAGIAAAQVPAPPKSPAKSTAQLDAGEPRADTSAPSPGDPAASSPSAGPSASPSATGPSPAPTSRTAAKPAAARAAGNANPKTPGAADRVDLSTATVTGDREQPKVMYIVPWKKSDIGDQSGKPMNSLLDEVLAPVDRDEFKREVVYYDAVKAAAPQNGAPAAPKQGEK